MRFGRPGGGRFRHGLERLHGSGRSRRRPHPIVLLLHPALVPVERPHAIVAAGQDDVRDLSHLARPNGGLRGRAAEENLAFRHPQLQGCEELESLANHADQHVGELGADAALGLSRKRHADPAQRFATRRRVHGREDQVSRFRGIQREANDFRRAHLAHDEYVGIFPQRIHERLLEACAVCWNLPLTDERLVIGEDVLERGLEREDVPCARQIDPASVVDLPLPVGPEITASPLVASMSLRRSGCRLQDRRSLTAGASSRTAIATPRIVQKRLTRQRRPLATVDTSAEPRSRKRFHASAPSNAWPTSARRAPPTGSPIGVSSPRMRNTAGVPVSR